MSRTTCNLTQRNTPKAGIQEGDGSFRIKKFLGIRGGNWSKRHCFSLFAVQRNKERSVLFSGCGNLVAFRK